MNQSKVVAEQLLEVQSERPKGHVLKSPKKPGVNEKNKAAKQREDIKRDTGK